MSKVRLEFSVAGFICPSGSGTESGKSIGFYGNPCDLLNSKGYRDGDCVVLSVSCGHKRQEVKAEVFHYGLGLGFCYPVSELEKVSCFRLDSKLKIVVRPAA